MTAHCAQLLPRALGAVKNPDLAWNWNRCRDVLYQQIKGGDDRKLSIECGYRNQNHESE